MSTPATTPINEAAALVGDPAFTRITQPTWTVFLNTAARDLARKMRLIRRAATFDLVANDPEYALPSDCIQIIGMQYNLTPSDQTTWMKAKEMFEDEHQVATNGSYSAGNPTRYLPRPDTFMFYPMPDTTIAAGGKITYWGMPDEVTNISSQSIPVMDFLRDSLRDRMVTFALRRLEKWDAASMAEKEWEAALTVDRDRFEDRSADRRTALRPRSSWTRFSGQT